MSSSRWRSASRPTGSSWRALRVSRGRSRFVGDDEVRVEADGTIAPLEPLTPAEQERRRLEVHRELYG
jgi:hypothetical protein